MLWVVLLLLARPTNLVAQSEDYQTYIYDSRSGLPVNVCNSICEDDLGYLWIGTFGGGLVRFDGKEFVNYTLTDGILSNIVLDVAIDRGKDLWALHRRGLSRFDGHRFKTFSVPSVKGSAALINVVAIGDSVFFSGPGRLLGYIYRDSLYDLGSAMPDSLQIADTNVLNERMLVLMLSDNTLRVIRPGGTASYPMPFSCEGGVCRLVAFSALSDDKLLMSNQRNGTYYLDLTDGTSGRFDDHTFVSFIDRPRNAGWLGNRNNLIRVDLERDSPRVILEDIQLNDLMVDQYGVTWVCSSMGLIKYYKKVFQRAADCVRDVAMGVAVTPDGALWTGTQFNGLIRTMAGECKQYSDPYFVNRNRINQVLCDSQGTLWVASLYGLGRYDPDHDKFVWLTQEHGLPGTSINAIVERSDGSLLVATSPGGISVVRGDTAVNFFASNRNFPSSNSIHDSPYHQRVYAGVSGELYELTPDSIRMFRLPELKEALITTIDSFRDSLLILGSLGSGVTIFNPRTGFRKTVDRNSGLHNVITFFARPHPDGSVWVGLQDGFTNLRFDDNLGISRLRHYSNSSGLDEAEANQFANHFTDSVAIFGTTDGVYRYLQEEDAQERYRIHMTRVQLFFSDSALTDFSKPSQDFFSIPEQLSLPSDQNHLTFHFNVANRTGSESTLFSYMLQGFDQTWSLQSTRKTATYNNLPAGDYTFKVLATDASGGWMKEPLVYTFSIRPAFYQTPAFILICVFGAAGVIFWIAHVRAAAKYDVLMKINEARTTEKDRLRRQLVKDFHDELGNYLARIINYINLLRINNGRPFTKDELYTKIEEMSRKLYTGTKELIWSIDYQLDSADSLFIYTRDFGQSLFADKAVFKAYSTAAAHLKVRDGAGRDVVLICKEALTNAFKHSNAGEIIVSFSQEGDRLRIEVSDNGKGLPDAVQSSGLGLKNFRERADKIKATLNVVTGKDQGTSVILLVPLDEKPFSGNPAARQKTMERLTTINN